jgi:hypothetical protein
MTIDTAGAAPAPPQPAAPSKNVFERIAGVLFSPAETFADIARRPDILWPLLIIIIIGYATTFVMMPRMDMDAAFAEQEAQMRKQNMSDADIERAQNIGKGFMKVMTFVGPAVGVLWYLVVAVVLWGACRMMGGQGDFKQAFSATLYAWMPLIIFGIILTIVAVARGSIDPTQMATAVKSNPAFLVDMKEQPVLASFLATFDIFTIWTVVLLVFGFSALSRLSKAKVATIVLVLWGLMIVVKLGFAALGAARMNA